MFATGIFGNNEIEDLGEVLYYGINEQYIEHCKECKEEYHDCCWEDQPEDNLWLGYDYNEDTDEFIPNKKAEFQGVNRGYVTQVCNSQWLIVGCKRAFQGCYPGFQAYLDTEDFGDIVAYSLPPDCLIEELQERIISLNQYNAKDIGVTIIESLENGTMKTISHQEIYELTRNWYGNNLNEHYPSIVYACMSFCKGIISGWKYPEG